MIPTAKVILFSRTFPGQNYHFPGQSIQDLKVINQDIYAKKHIIFIQCMIDYWHFYGTPSSSALLVVWSTHFYLNFFSTIKVYFYRDNIYSCFFLVLSGFFHRQYFFRDIFLNSRIVSRTCGNPVTLCGNKMKKHPSERNIYLTDKEGTARKAYHLHFISNRQISILVPSWIIWWQSDKAVFKKQLCYDVIISQ